MRKNSLAQHHWDVLVLERKHHLRTKRLLAEAKRRMKSAMLIYGVEIRYTGSTAHRMYKKLVTPTDKALKR